MYKLSAHPKPITSTASILAPVNDCNRQNHPQAARSRHQYDYLSTIKTKIVHFPHRSSKKKKIILEVIFSDELQ